MEDISYRENPIYQLHRKYLTTYYEYFYQKFSGVGIRLKPNPNYKFTPTEKGQKVIRDFILQIAKDSVQSFGPIFYFNYFLFQWSYWANSEKIEKLTINPASILDKSAWKRWCQRNTDGDYYLYEFSVKYNIRKEEVTAKVQTVLNPNKTEYSELSAGEEMNRKRFENGDEKRLTHCYVTTTLFSPRSPTCRDCILKRKCKELLKELYPELAKSKLE